MSTQQEKFKVIADKIRAYLKTEDLIVPNDFANKIDDVHEAGIEQGKQSAYDEFWDAAQQNGQRTVYDYFFAGGTFIKENARAKYPIRPTSAYGMFERSKHSARPITSFDDIGVEIDFSNCIAMVNTFVNSNIKVIPRLTSKNGSNCNFSGCCQYATELETIGEFKVTSTSIGNTGSMFTGCTKLKDVTMVGTLAVTISFSACPLTKASIESIINSLSTAVTGKTLTLKKSAKEAAFTDEEWATLIADKSNWTISLV